MYLHLGKKNAFNIGTDPAHLFCLMIKILCNGVTVKPAYFVFVSQSHHKCISAPCRTGVERYCSGRARTEMHLAPLALGLELPPFFLLKSLCHTNTDPTPYTLPKKFLHWNKAPFFPSNKYFFSRVHF